METVLQLPTSASQLPELNKGISRFQYEQHAPTRDITNESFPKGAIHTRFEISGTKRWVPSKSYIRMRCTLTKNGGTTQLESADDVAPTMGLMSNLFQSGEFRIADKTVSRIGDYMPQVDALRVRTTKSRAWLESTGKSANMWEADAKDRREKVSSDGQDIKKVGAYEMTSRLQLGHSGLTTVGIAVTGVATFAVGNNPDTDTIFVAGDEIEIDYGGAVGTVRHHISAVPAGSKTLQLNHITHIVQVAAAVEFRRYRKVVSNSRRVKEFELVWQPPLSIFSVEQALPAGKYELTLNPQIASAYKTRVVESLIDNRTLAADFDFNVKDMYLYTATLESTRVDDLTYMIDLDEVRCQTEDAKGSNFPQKNFDVSPSTYALTCAFQEASAGSDTLYSASKLKSRNDEDLNLTRLFLSYGGSSRPPIDADPEYLPGSAKDYTTQRYSDSLLQSGQYFQEGGSETIEEWQKRGPYYHFNWPRSGQDRSTRAQVNFQFSTLTSSRVLMFDWYRSIATIMVKNSRVVDVRITDA